MDYLLHYTGFISGNRGQSHISLLPDGKCRLPVCQAMLLHRICLPICLKAMSLVFSNNYLITIPVKILQYQLIFDFFGHLGPIKQTRKTHLWHVVSTYSCNCEWICKFSTQQLCVWPADECMSNFHFSQLLFCLYIRLFNCLILHFFHQLLAKFVYLHTNERSKINTIQ